MNEDIVARIEANPKYHELVSKRSSYSIVMSILMIIVYYGYILLIAFNKEWLATKLAPGMVTSVGIPLGVGVIIFTIIITNIYVRRANTQFDDMSAEVIREANKK
ncbi:MAG TPA: DUF485 domain-containing protein [Accumulibacter sp.]|nr:DUF485 domain-containing protein [Accumulibacter sp.]HMW17512.1 DUF485 domain-containing protein [Accumulibacter sp.]HMX21832.1 DUF485 domain-containing protein [Accumulibacter sp.]HMY07603.1 DUF485 domain-containing protein [Accumulibacter sp.]HNC17656.1 DUF485 domain-containing protein [Accumulibacter sp.]